MPLVGGGQSGAVGGVETASGPSSSSGGGGGSGTQVIYTGSALIGSSSTLYMDNAESLAGGSALPLRIPISAQTVTKIRLGAPSGTTSPPTLNLIKYAAGTGARTVQLSCTLPASAPAGTSVSASGSITYNAGDAFDLELVQSGVVEGPSPFVGVVETSVGGAGGGGSVITDGTTIIGNGTVGSPLAANPTAALTPDMQGYFKALFQQKTGLHPLLFSVYADDFTYQATQQPSGYGSFSSGTGATDTWLATAGSGIMQLQGPTSGAGQCDWSSGVRTSGPYQQIANVLGKRYLIAYRVACGAAPNANSQVSCGFAYGTNFFGLGYVGAAANWKYVRGANHAVANIADTGKPINSGGAQYLWFYVWSDTTNIRFCIDVVGGAAEVIAEPTSNLNGAPVSGYPYLYSRGPGAGDIINLDAVVCCAER